LSHAFPGNSWLGIKNVTEYRKEVVKGAERERERLDKKKSIFKRNT
jgi:hypothetical protein